jgi:hypothetical protein
MIRRYGRDERNMIEMSSISKEKEFFIWYYFKYETCLLTWLIGCHQLNPKCVFRGRLLVWIHLRIDRENFLFPPFSSSSSSFFSACAATNYWSDYDPIVEKKRNIE